jgi:hypothetical protein
MSQSKSVKSLAFDIESRNGIQNDQKHYLSVVTQIMSLQKPCEHNANMTSEILPLALRTHLMCLYLHCTGCLIFNRFYRVQKT